MTYEEALQYFNRRQKRTDLPDKCEAAEELAIKAIEQAIENATQIDNKTK